MREIPGKNGGTLLAMEKGETLNPNGRPKKLPDIEILLIDALGGSGEEALAIMKALVAKAKKGDTRAAEILLDRAFGKAKQDITQKTVIQDERKDLSDLNEDELQFLERIYDKIGAGKGKVREGETQF